jgi:glycine hydroxymethyltransferase
MAISKIIPLIKEHEAYREDGLNLVVSENFLSENVRNALASDLASRYYAEWYGGAGYARKIVEATEELAREVFRVKYAQIMSLSGNICDLAALLAFTRPGDKMAMLSFKTGGYPFGVTKFDREIRFIPVEKDGFDIDLEGAKKLIAEEGLKLLVLGASCILFPQPVREISRFIKDSGLECACVYDGSHVLGLIATGAFQDPLGEGADVLIGSTHKTFFGPQGGLILTNSEPHAKALNYYLDFDLDTGLGLVDNPHVNRITALGIALEEMLEDPGYGERVIENARALACALDALGVPVRFKERGYTASHQVLLDLDPAGAEQLCHRLEKARIFTDIGGRIGTAEVTRRGMAPQDMKEIAERVAEVYHR